MSLSARKALLWILLPVLNVPALFSGGMYISAFYHRRQASRLLECIRPMRPGITSEADFRVALQPFSAVLRHGEESVVDKPPIVTDEYAIGNFPTRILSVFDRLPAAFAKFTAHHLLLYPSEFYVSPRFEEGTLSKLYVMELQEGVDGARPFEASVTFYSKSSEAPDSCIVGEKFTGYCVHAIPEAQGQAQGKSIEESSILRKYLALDNRATPDQRSNALQFRLNCFTRIGGCRDASLLLRTQPSS